MQHAALAQAGHVHTGIRGDELFDALFARLARMTGRIGVEIMRIYLKSDSPIARNDSGSTMAYRW